MDNTINVPPPNILPLRGAGGNPVETAGGRSTRADSAALAAKASSRPAIVQVGGVADAAQKVRDFLQITRRDLEFSVDKDSDTIVIRVLDAATGKLVRQIPPDEVLAMVKRLDQPDGVLFHDRA